MARLVVAIPCRVKRILAGFMSPPVDPITRSVVQHRLSSIVAEMAAAQATEETIMKHALVGLKVANKEVAAV